MLTKEQAIAVWKGILATSSDYGGVALYNLGTRADGAQAIAYFKELVEKHPTSQYAPEAHWWLFWGQVEQGKTQAAINFAKAAIDKYPGNRVQPRFAFWCGKLSERLNSKETAKVFYKRATTLGASNYYAYRSQARLTALAGGKDPGWTMYPGRPYPDLNWKWPAPPKAISYNEIAAKTGTTCALLCKLGQWDECLQLLPEKTNPLIRSLILANLSLPLDAINSAASHVSGTPKKTGLWMFAYPLLYSNQVAKNAKDNELDPFLVHGLIREESRYNSMATSRSNAIGLMQLLPGTAFGVAKNMGLSIHTNDEVYNPNNNIALGTHYLAYVLKRHSGNALAAVASYNGGPNAVAKWIKGHSDMDTFVETIPVTETRDYVRKVFGSFWNYQAIYR
jgi:soluble lytic murein transglycosylase